MRPSGLLKFVDSGKTTPTSRGIRTFPHQTYGVSPQSPDHFQHRHTMINPHGYQYRHENAAEFEYKSQQKRINLGNNSKDLSEEMVQSQPRSHFHQFHLKKGRLGQFWDKNGWMNTVYVMSGDQRSKKSRQLNNFDRTLRIQSLKKCTQYDSHLLYKPEKMPSSYRTLENIMSEKVKMRGRRNREAENKLPRTQRTISNHHRSCLQDENVRIKMRNTTKQWYKPLKQVKQIADMSSTGLTKLEKDLPQGDLEEWQRKTCAAKWYQKKKNREVENAQEEVEVSN